MTSQQNIRNFSIIAHIDHGKTTLTDRLLLATNTITQREFHDRLLDSNPIERERGITIKLAPVTLRYKFPSTKHQAPNNTKIQNINKNNFGFRLAPLRSSSGISDFEFSDSQYLLNLIDTPGHVDFGYEVSRSLAACEGALLLIDATQGIQAQTLANLEKARKLDLKIIVVLNKIDLPAANPDKVTQEVISSLNISPDDIITLSAKTGHNVDQLFSAIITKIPPPAGDPNKPAKALIFNSIFHPHKGVIAFVKVVEGRFIDQPLTLLASSTNFTAKQLGIFTPDFKPASSLSTGQVGYLATGLKDVHLVKSGDTITATENLASATPLSGYQDPQPVVYMDLYPADAKDYLALKDAIEKLSLNDASLNHTPVSSAALSKGFRTGFLGALHAEIVLERLSREYNIDIIPTTPTVIYKVTTTSGEQITVKNPADLPDQSLVATIQEPIAAATIFTPKAYLGAIMNLMSDHRADLINQNYLGTSLKLEYLLPLSEIITGFYDQLKSASQGYASLEYELFDYQDADAIKLSVLINHEPVEALSQIVIRQKAVPTGKRIVSKLKEAIPRQLIQIPIQAAIGGEIIARETIKPFRKDVTAKLYGGDISRRKKLLEKQKKGKAKRAVHAKVDIPQQAYLAVLKQ